MAPPAQAAATPSTGDPEKDKQIKGLRKVSSVFPTAQGKQGNGPTKILSGKTLGMC